MKKKKSDIVFYLICTIATVVSVRLLIVSDDIETILVSIGVLLFFGVGGICYYVLDKKGNEKIRQEKVITITYKRGKMIALLLTSFSFMFVFYLMLPFNHLFDDLNTYTPVLGYIIGTIGVLFSGLGFTLSIVRLIKPSFIMQLSDEGILFPDGLKKQMFIAWKEVAAILISDKYFSVYLKNPDLYPVNKVVNFINKKVTGTNINIPRDSINYNIEQLKNFIENKSDFTGEIVEV